MPFPAFVPNVASLVIAAGLLTGPSLTGPARVVDGDTMRVDGIAVRLFGIDDIRIFWSDDERILSQFRRDTISQYAPVHTLRFPSVQRDLSFWLEGAFEQNEFFEICRDTMEDWQTLESVQLVDQYTSSQGRRSLCFRLTYRALDRTLTIEEVNSWHEALAARVADQMPVKVR